MHDTLPSLDLDSRSRLGDLVSARTQIGGRYTGAFKSDTAGSSHNTEGRDTSHECGFVQLHVGTNLNTGI